MLSLQLIDGLEAGTDEAGRGCLVGPVTAAAVILPADFNEPLLNDSKKLTEKQPFLFETNHRKARCCFCSSSLYSQKSR